MASEDCRIRPAQAQDEIAILELARALWRLNRAQRPQRDDDAAVLAARTRHIEERLQTPAPGEQFYVAQDGPIVGYGRTQLINPPPWEDNGTERVGVVDEIYVQEAARGRGIGRLLLKTLVADLTAAGAVHIRLHSYAWNQGANALYQAFGFVPYAYSWEIRR